VKHVTKAILLTALLTTSCKSSPVENARRSFMKITKKVEASYCFTTKVKKKKKTTEKIECKEESASATASSVAVASASIGTFVLTAAHVCDDDSLRGRLEAAKKVKEIDSYEVTETIKVLTLSSNSYKADVVALNHDLDLCLMFVEDLNMKPIKRHYKALQNGQLVYNIASPLGIFAHDAVPVFAGHYSGNLRKGVDIFSVPATGGSSGSPVVNEEGALVGMVHSVFFGFRHVAMSPTLADINKFIDQGVDKYENDWYINLLKMSRPKMENP